MISVAGENSNCTDNSMLEPVSIIPQSITYSVRFGDIRIPAVVLVKEIYDSDYSSVSSHSSTSDSSRSSLPGSGPSLLAKYDLAIRLYILYVFF